MAFGCCVYSGQHLRYNNDRSQMLRSDDPVQQSYEAYRREFPYQDDLIVVASGGERSERGEALRELSQRLQAPTFAGSLWRVDARPFEKVGLFALSLESLHRLDDQLRRTRPLIGSDLAGMLERVLALDDASLRALAPTLGQVMAQLGNSLKGRGTFDYVSPLGEVPPSPIRDGWIDLPLGSDAQILIVALAREASLSAALPQLHQALQEVRRLFPRVHLQAVGEMVANEEDGKVSLRSALGCSLLSLILVKSLFLLTAAHRRRPQLALLALFSGISWSVAWASVTLGELNIVSVNFPATLVGLGMDFAIHLLFRIEEEVEHGGGEEAAWQRTYATVGSENLVGGLATAAAFFSLYFTPFRGVQQLGWVAAFGLIFVFVAMSLLYPALLHVYGEMSCDRAPSWLRWRWLLPLEERWRARSGLVLAVTVVVTLVLVSSVGRVRFDSNLLHMTWGDSLARQSERLFRERQGSSCLFLVSLCQDEGQLLEREERLRAQPGVAHCESLASLVRFICPQPEKARVIESIVLGARSCPDPRSPKRLTSAELLRLRDRVPPLLQRLRQRLKSLGVETASLEEVARITGELGPGGIQDALQAFETAWSGDLRQRLKLLRSQDWKQPSLDQIPAFLLQRFRGASGKWLIKIYPRPDVWEEHELIHLLGELEPVAPHITGTPLLNQRYLQLLHQGYSKASWMALSVIVVLLLLHFRHPGRAALALFPKLLGLAWMLGWMGWLGIDLNPANATALPLTLGVGLAFGVHVLHRTMSGGGTVFGGSTGAAVAVSAASTMLGYASLTLAPHRGIASLGWVMLIGVSANVVAAVVVLPCLVDCLSRRKRD